MRVLVTGGSGFVGKNLKKHKPDWIYVSSKEYDLKDKGQCAQMFKHHKPDAVIHLAAKVGGIKSNAEQQAVFLLDNCLINLNVVEEAYRSGVKRLLAALSTCAYPNTSPSYPFEESEIFDGPPPETNLSYGYAKRLLHVQCLSYSKQYGVDYTTFAPSNLYGPEDNFNPESSHFVAALVRKIANAEQGETIEFWGTGKTLKQELYVDDLCFIIPKLLENHKSKDAVIVAPDENLSIIDMVNNLLKVVGKDLRICFNGFLDGQFRKDGKNEKLKSLVPGLKFTKFEEGILKTYRWYLENYN